MIRYCATIQFHLLENMHQLTYCTRQKSKHNGAFAHNTCTTWSVHSSLKKNSNMDCILKFHHFVFWSSLEWHNLLTVCNTVKYYVMCQNGNWLDHAVKVWVGNLVVPLLGLVRKEEISVALLYRQKLWKVLKFTAVYVLSLRTVLFHTECVWADRNVQETSDMCDRCIVHGTLLWCQRATRNWTAEATDLEDRETGTGIEIVQALKFHQRSVCGEQAV